MKLDNTQNLDKKINDYIESLPSDILISDLLKDKHFRSLMNDFKREEGALNE